jgi:hypothetical protein
MFANFGRAGQATGPTLAFRASELFGPDTVIVGPLQDIADHAQHTNISTTRKHYIVASVEI